MVFFVDEDGLDHPSNGLRISEIGPINNPNFTIRGSDIAYNSGNGQFLTVWGGEDTGTDGELEIFGQLLDLKQPLQQFRISDMGPTGNDDFDALNPSVACNMIDDEYLVVWEGDDNTGSLTNDEFEIFGQLLTADGFEIGADFRISDMGPNGDVDFVAFRPCVTYNSADNEYLVVWQGDNSAAGANRDEFEIFGQRLMADGSEVGTNDFRISDMGPNNTALFDAVAPSVAYNTIDNEYFVVWSGDDDAGGVVNEEFEIFGQRLMADGSEVGMNDFRISDMGPDSSALFDAVAPSVVYNTIENEYLVVWSGDDNTGAVVNGEFEVYGQRLMADGSEVGTNDFRISDMGLDGDDFDALDPSVVYNSTDNEYLVVWEGEDDTGNLVEDEFEIFGQRLMADGSEVGTNDFRISDMGPAGDVNFEALNPSVAYNTINNNYLVVWQGDDNENSFQGEFEVYGQLISSTGSEIGTNDFRISEIGPAGNRFFEVRDPVIIFNASNNNFLVAWEAEDNIRNLVNEEFEIYVELIDASALLPCLLTLDDTQIGSPIATGVYEASDIITSSGLIPAGNDVIFDAGGSTTLLPDFEVQQGAVFEVLLDGCN